MALPSQAPILRERIILPPASIGTNDELRHVGVLRIPLDGDPRQYPLDSYEGWLDVEVRFEWPQRAALFKPFSMRLLARPSSDPAVRAFRWQSVALRFLGQFDERAQAYVVPDLRSSIEDRLWVRAARPFATTQLFVWSLILVPAILIVLLALRLATTPRRSVEALAGVAAIMLAILPIRLVLVPAEIGSLTLVDYALGIEMAWLAAGVALAYLWGGGPRSHPHVERSPTVRTHARRRGKIRRAKGG